MSDLSRLLADNNMHRSRSQKFITDFLATQQLVVVNNCNICQSEDTTIISHSDRYGAPLRAAHCNRCGLVFLVDRLSAQGYGEFYEKIYRPLISRYQNRDVTPQSMLAEQQSYANHLLTIFKGLAFQTGGALIDIGGSTGAIANHFARERGYQATILDPSSAELAVAQEKGCETIHALFEDWDNPQELQYDLVLCCRTIDHFIDLKSSLLKLRQLMKPAGYLFIDVVDYVAVSRSTGEVHVPIKLDHCYYLSLENTPAILRSVGLQPIYADITSVRFGRYICRQCEPEPIPSHIEDWARMRVREISNSISDARRAANQLEKPTTLRQRLGRIRRAIAGS